MHLDRKMFWPFYYFLGRPVKQKDLTPLSKEEAQKKVDEFFKAFPAMQQFSKDLKDEQNR